MQSGNLDQKHQVGLEGFEVENQEVNQLVNIRANLIKEYSRLRDYRSDKNALMKQVDCAAILHRTIVEIDSILKGHVKFEE